MLTRMPSGLIRFAFVASNATTVPVNVLPVTDATGAGSVGFVQPHQRQTRMQVKKIFTVDNITSIMQMNVQSYTIERPSTLLFFVIEQLFFYDLLCHYRTTRYNTCIVSPCREIGEIESHSGTLRCLQVLYRLPHDV